MRFAGFVCISTLVFGCASTHKPIDPTRIPPELASVMRSCDGLDGSANVQAFHKDTLAGSVDVEWVSKDGGWVLEAIDPLARTLLAMSYEEGETTLTATGPLTSRVPLLSIDEGYLVVDGHFTAVKAKELPCYWAGYFPKTETTTIYDIKRREHGFDVEHGDDFRKVKTTLEFLSRDKTSYELCSHIHWTRLLGLIRRNIVLCTKKADHLSGTMTILDDHRIQWTNLD